MGLLSPVSAYSLTVWCLVGNGGIEYGDYHWGLYRDYCRDPFPHSLLSTRELNTGSSSKIVIVFVKAGSRRSCLIRTTVRAEVGMKTCTRLPIKNYRHRYFHPASVFRTS